MREKVCQSEVDEEHSPEQNRLLRIDTESMAQNRITLLRPAHTRGVGHAAHNPHGQGKNTENTLPLPAPPRKTFVTDL